MSFIEILADPTAPFTWQWSDGGKTYETVFTLRLIPNEKNEELRRKYKETVWVNHQRVTEFGAGYGDDLLDYVIVDWTGLQAKHPDGTSKPQPCTREAKLALPERLKGKIIDVTAGKEAAMDAGLLDSKSPRP